MPRPMGETAYKEVRGLSRGLQVLQALNHGKSGQMTVADVAAMTGLHRTTVRRLLETLVAEDFVRRSTSDDSFRLRLQVRTLSEGFTDDEWIAQIATPVMGELLREVSWPTDLCTPDGGAMIIRESTHRFSRFSFHRSMVGARLPILCTAAGRAYFASCPARERKELLRLLPANDPEQAALARSPRRLAGLLRQVWDDGYAANEGAWSKEPKFSAIALPICQGDAVLGSLNMIFTARSMSVKEAAAQHLPAMRRAITQISSIMTNNVSCD